MLVNTFGKKITASLVVKNSAFYIEVAKFVQAYSIILKNPNDFLKEIGEPEINEQNEKLSWENLSKIMQTCNFGFVETPTNSDLLVFYNYAIEIGSIAKHDKRVATVDDIADAQKNYYNFVDEAKDRAEAEFLKQHRISKLREKEVVAVHNQLHAYTVQKWTAFSLAIAAVILFCLGAFGLFFTNPLVELIGCLIPVWERRYIGSIILLIIAVIMFCYCDKWNRRSKQNYLKLEHASRTIFSRNNKNFVTEQILKYKLDTLKRDLQVIHNELNDESKTFDVKNNIEKLSESNEYYKKYLSNPSVHSAESNAMQMRFGDERFDYNNEKINEEYQEIILEGQFDEQAYNEKFEQSKRNNVKDIKQEESQENNNLEFVSEKPQLNENEEQRVKQEELESKLQEQNKLNEENLKIENENLTKENIDELMPYIEEILGKDDFLEYEREK